MPALNENYPVKVIEFSDVRTHDGRTAPYDFRTLTFNQPSLGNNVRTGTSQPGWRDKLAKGIDASTPYNTRQLKYSSGAHFMCSAFGKQSLGYELRTSGRYLCYGQPNLQFLGDTATQNRALANIKKQLASRAGSAHVLAPIAEGRELHGLIVQAASFTGDFLKSVAYAKKTKGKSLGKFLSNAWLGYNFGMAPLVKDIGDAGKSISSYLARQDISTRLTASASKTGLYTYTPSTTISAVPIGFQSIVKKGYGKYTLSYQYVGGFDLALASSNDYSVLDQLGIQLNQIPATAWELTGYSWIVDYFTNVGEYLSDVFSSPPGTTRFLVVIRRYSLDFEHSFTVDDSNHVGSGTITDKITSGIARGNYFELTRTPLLSLPHAGLYIKSFDQIAGHSVGKLLNLASILGKGGKPWLSPHLHP